MKFHLNHKVAQPGRHAPFEAQYLLHRAHEKTPPLVRDEILQSSGPEPPSQEGKENWGKREGKEWMKACQGRMEVPSVNETDRIKESIRTRDRASSF